MCEPWRPFDKYPLALTAPLRRAQPQHSPRSDCIPSSQISVTTGGVVIPKRAAAEARTGAEFTDQRPR